MRFEVFKNTLIEIESHDKELEGFEVAINAMSDWTDDEFALING